jgi:hypothetical protein
MATQQTNELELDDALALAFMNYDRIQQKYDDKDWFAKMFEVPNEVNKVKEVIE